MYHCRSRSRTWCWSGGPWPAGAPPRRPSRSHWCPAPGNVTIWDENSLSMSWKKHFESIGLLVILIDLRLASWILLSGILEKMKSTMASSRDICNINIIALLPPLPMWPYSISKSSFCNSWLVFHNDHLKTMVGFESFDLIYNIIIVLTNTALAMIHIQIIFCCLWLFSHHHQHHYISRHCFFFLLQLLTIQDHLKTLVGPKSIDHVVDVRLQFAIGQVQLLQGGLFLLKRKGISLQSVFFQKKSKILHLSFNTCIRLTMASITWPTSFALIFGRFLLMFRLRAGNGMKTSLKPSAHLLSPQ